MASPISPGEVLQLVKFAYSLFTSCQAAKGDFIQVGNEVNAMRSVMELVQIRLEDPTSIINKLDNKEKSVRKQLGVHVRNCEQALKDVQSLLTKYNKMNFMDKLAWAWAGHDEVQGLMANLSSFATQLDSFVNALALRGIDKLYQKQESMRIGIGRIEELLEKNGGNEKAAVDEVMQNISKTSNSRSHCQRYQTVIADYALKTKKDMKDQTAMVEREPRGRKVSPGSLAVPGTHKRAKSVESAKDKARPDIKRSHSTKSATGKKQIYVLECWLIQIKSGDALLLKWQFSEKELQPRGQWKLEQMAKQFKAAKSSKLKDNNDLVDWVIRDRQKKEEHPDYLWRPYSAKIESKGSLTLNMGVEEQAMVIIKRDLTPEAKATAEAKEKKAQAEKAAADKKARVKADAKKAKEIEVKRNEKKLNERRKEEADKSRKEAEINALREEVERLRIAQKNQNGPSKGIPIGKADDKSKSPSPKPSSGRDRKGSDAERATNQRKPGAKPDMSQVDCKYFPDCKNPSCQFRHPKMPMCWNGANCTKLDCPYTHKQCTHSPCLNTKCSYRHSPGQQKIKANP